MTPFVAVGGLGGSGTRVVSLILQRIGIYLGPVLNPQLDNLLFTLMFKRGDWITSFPLEHEIHRIIRIFTHALRQGVGPAFAQLAEGEAEALFMKSRGYGVTRAWFDAIMSSLPPEADAYTGFGWKEPNTHVFLPQLATHLPNLKYVHVIRHGLDMALSANKQQLVNWGPHFGVKSNNFTTEVSAQLRYWLTANRRAVEIGREMGPDRFLLLNYDALCADFDDQIRVLGDFLDRPLSGQDRDAIQTQIDTRSIGRYRFAPVSTFANCDREAVAAFGFEVD